MRFHDGNSIIIGLSYISEVRNSLVARRERDEEYERERKKQRERESAVGISFASFSPDSRNMFR